MHVNIIVIHGASWLTRSIGGVGFLWTLQRKNNFFFEYQQKEKKKRKEIEVKYIKYLVICTSIRQNTFYLLPHYINAHKEYFADSETLAERN